MGGSKWDLGTFRSKIFVIKMLAHQKLEFAKFWKELPFFQFKIKLKKNLMFSSDDAVSTLNPGCLNDFLNLNSISMNH